MSTTVVRSYNYRFGDLLPGESQFKRGGNWVRMRDAWYQYKRNHTECEGWKMEFERTISGVVYRRIK